MEKETSGKRAGSGKKAAGQDTERRVAEWVTLSVSTLLILAISAYLLIEATRPVGPYVPVEARPLPEEVRQEGKQYILPIEITNRGRRTVRDLQIEVKLRAPGGTSETREWTIDFLAEQSRQKAYLYLPWPPDPTGIEAKPLLYRLE
jgi:uncharacterized protein (TIGR02588 family)